MDAVLKLATVTISVILLGYLYYKWRLSYWDRKGLPVLEPEPANSVRTWVEVSKRQYQRIKERCLRHAGGYWFIWPTYYPVDNEIIKCILQKDFEHFMNHGTYFNEKADPLSGTLFHLEGSKWRYMRTKLTPTFTSGKIKMMFPIFVECSDGLEQLLDQYAKNNESLDIKEVAARYTTDTIGSAAFGVKCNSLVDPEAEFRKVGRSIFKNDYLTMCKYTLIGAIPKAILVACGVRTTKKSVENLMMNVIRETIEYREKNKVVRKDFLDLLLQLKNSGRIVDDDVPNSDQKPAENTTRLTFNEIAAQCYVFFLGGFESSSTTMTFAIYEMALHQDIQDKVRQEVNEVLTKHGNNFTYEAVKEMIYLEKVFNETLRKYPPNPNLMRVCTKNYKVPGTNVTIEAGTHVDISILGIHHDPEYYPNPEVFDPERFSEENTAKRPACTFIPFGEGPRNCIGSRFGRMQTIVGLAKIIMNFKVTMNKKTIHPLELDPLSFVLAPKDGMWVNVTRV